MSSDHESPVKVAPKRSLPVELQTEAPRKTPASFWKSAIGKQERVRVLSLFFFGVALIGIHFLPIVQNSAVYVVPLKYLPFLGGVLVVASIGFAFLKTNSSQAREKIRNSAAGLAKVNEVKLIPAAHVQGKVSQKAFQVDLTVERIEGGQPVAVKVNSEEIPVNEKVGLSFDSGDWIPVLWDPADFPNSVLPYAFLNASPDHQIDREPTNDSWQVWLMVFIFLLVGIWNFYVYKNLMPLVIEWPNYPIIVLGILAGSFLVGVWGFFLRWKHHRYRNQVNQIVNQNQVRDPFWKPRLQIGRRVKQFSVASLILIASFVTTFFTAIFVNAQWDQSQAKKLPTSIREISSDQTGMFLHYFRIVYRLQGEDQDREIASTPMGMARFRMPLAATTMREGYFGWPWIESVDPLSKDLPDGFGMTIFKPLDNPEDRKSLQEGAKALEDKLKQ
ncbi:MAG: hypothetical protein AAF623_04580 [Planctomycetota bacterium]